LDLQKPGLYADDHIDHEETAMMKREAGFSLIELLIVMVLIGVVLAAVSNSFVGLLRNYKQQSKIAETNIEGIIGLEMLRRDLESAGYGLPWVVGTAYNEAANATAAVYNDSPNAPRAVLCGDNVGPGTLGIVNGSDYLVLKAANLATNDACAKWTYLLTDGTTTNWNTSGKENFTVAGTERVIVLSPGTNINNSRTLIVNGGNFSTTKGNTAAFANTSETRIIYGMDDAGANPLRMPFNRADYYVTTTGATIPGRCAQGTGTLVKAIVNQNGGLFTGNTFPLLDCVADMQVVTFLDTAGTGPPYTQSDGIGGVNATSAQIVRDQLKEIQVYILAHEGQKDTSYKYTYPGNLFHVGPGVVGSVGGRDFNLAAITNYQNYRWKLYTLIVRPNNLR
jgi:prepilin-type N-terminal cleavage/methylation domain-containing protein